MTGTIKISEAKRTERSQPRGGAREYREFNAKPRIYFHVEGENILENLAYRFDRPSKLYRAMLPDALEAMGLPRDTKCVWSQKAGCSCGCSPAFIVQDHIGGGMPWDGWVTIVGDDAKVKDDADQNRIADRLGQLENQGVMDALRAANEGPAPAIMDRTGRSGAGNLRNFKAMSDSKLDATMRAVFVEDNDEEAIDAIRDELRRRSG